MEDEYTIDYPRRSVVRALVRIMGRLIVPLAFRIRISGRENFPSGGPLLVVGNHTAAMEAVLMVIYPPWQVEMLGSVDVPHEKITQAAASIYKFIPINRGHVDRTALVKSLDVLRQGGVLAVFPEGGIWDAGRMRARTGVAWLSYRANAPVLPIGFSGTTGALEAALRLKRPRLTMHVGQLMPAARLPEEQSRKAYFEAFATDVVEAIRALLPADDPARRPRIVDECFQLHVTVQANDGSPQTYPGDLPIQHAGALAKFLHRPAILKIFTSNLDFPTSPLQNLDRECDPEKIARAVRAILDYLNADNPYLLTYRFGPQEAEAMRLGLEELLALASWASRSGLRLTVTPVRRCTSPDGVEVVQVKQGKFERWM
jgi:1-acyl-sn-glycerol-3-phosphate acyltransferase